MTDKPGVGIVHTVGDLKIKLRQYDDDTPILMSGGEHASYYDTIYVGGTELIDSETGEIFHEEDLREAGELSDETIEHMKLSAVHTVILL